MQHTHSPTPTQTVNSVGASADRYPIGPIRRTIEDVWMILVLLVLLLGVGIYWFATVADRIEDDSRGMIDPNNRSPYGSKWLNILRWRDGGNRR
jgi:hypothetical protein